jgi:asparagine synthase (glutamine-hydrolysing)
MCGLVGIIGSGASAPISLRDLVRMVETLRHRGPDDEGLLGLRVSGEAIEYFGPETPEPVRAAIPALEDYRRHSSLIAAIGHRRLSILDTSAAGHQPMHDPSGQLWIAFTGEIYNFRELRLELEALGVSFRTNTDTEVILAAYDRWGPGCFVRFNGMWAIALLDLRRRQLLLSRDRFGIKPLYYAVSGGLLLFASEIKAILSHPAFRTSPNLDHLRDFLLLGALEYRSETAFDGVFRFPIASYATIDLDRPCERFSAIRFWDYESNCSAERFDPIRVRRIAGDYYDLLKDSVRLRLRADVPVGSALSGGLDSSSVVFLVNQLLREAGGSTRQVAFSTVHRDPAARECDESRFIDEVVSTLDIESHVIEPELRAIPSIHEAAVWCLESPYDGTGMPGMYVFGLARANGVTVTLDGQGADEQQAGYLNYFIQHLANAPPAEVVRSAFQLPAMVGTEPYVRFGVRIGLLRAIAGRRLLEGAAKLFGKNASPYLASLNVRLKDDCHRGLVNLIHYADSRSMMSSVESRMPFMDYRLVEFTAGVPACYKIYRGWTKYFARLAFAGKLPDSIVWRRDKLGWPMPDAHWMSGPLREWSDSLIASSDLVGELCRGVGAPGSPTEVIRRLNIAQWERVFWQRTGSEWKQRTDLARCEQFRLPANGAR